MIKVLCNDLGQPNGTREDEHAQGTRFTVEADHVLRVVGDDGSEPVAAYAAGTWLRAVKSAAA